jgi:hypothetical protein
MSMKITEQTVAEKLAAFLHHELSLAELVDWAEDAVFEGDVAEESTEELMNVLTRLGVADVREFGLTWEEVESLLRDLGYEAHVDIVKA